MFVFVTNARLTSTVVDNLSPKFHVNKEDKVLEGVVLICVYLK